MTKSDSFKTAIPFIVVILTFVGMALLAKTGGAALRWAWMESEALSYLEAPTPASFKEACYRASQLSPLDSTELLPSAFAFYEKLKDTCISSISADEATHKQKIHSEIQRIYVTFYASTEPETFSTGWNLYSKLVHLVHRSTSSLLPEQLPSPFDKGYLFCRAVKDQLAYDDERTKLYQKLSDICLAQMNQPVSSSYKLFEAGGTGASQISKLLGEITAKKQQEDDQAIINKLQQR